MPIELWPFTDGTAIPSSTLTHVPPSGSPSGSAIIVCPGGGYAGHASHEAEPVAEWAAALGIHAFILRYRVAPHRYPAPHDDAGRAVRTIRAHAPELGIDPSRIAILGFSAGGHLAGSVAAINSPGDPAHPDPVERVSSRPDLAILIYPVITLEPPHYHRGSLENLLGSNFNPVDAAALSLQNHVNSDTPPHFIVHGAADTGVPVENSLLLATALSANKVPFELFVPEHGWHGFGLSSDDPTLGVWTDLCTTWLRRHSFCE